MIPPDLSVPRLNPGRLSPFDILALALDFTLGDFVARLVFAASVRLMFDRARLTVCYHDDRPYKPFLLDCLPQADLAVPFSEERSLPVDRFNLAHGGVHRPPSSWRQTGMAAPHLVLTPSMMCADLIPSFDHRARLRIPDGRVAGLHADLAARGVRPSWFCVLHYREGGYEYRPDRPMRDADPSDFLALRDYVIDVLGGQVVRLGHRGMTAWPERPGYVDLSGADFALQCFAASRARFALTTPSGPSSLCSAFGTPTGQTNTVESFAIYNDHDRVLPKRVIRPDGRRLPVGELGDVLKETTLTGLSAKGWKVRPNSRDELYAMARLMFAETSGGWRPQPPSQAPVDRPNRISLPLTPKARNRFVEFGMALDAPALSSADSGAGAPADDRERAA